MADKLPPIWEGTAHTFAKHQILKVYLEAWMPIMSRQSRRVGAFGKELLFVDGFAGPGSYSGGEDGSPILALNLVLDHPYDFHIPVSFLFIEQDKERYDILKSTIKQYKEKASNSSRVSDIRVKRGDCQTLLNEEFPTFEKSGKKIGPAFIFLDQFGYSDVSMQLIKKIMKHPQCEVFAYLNWDRMNQFLTDESKWNAISNAFGSDDWKKVLDCEPKKKPTFLLKLYKDTLEREANSKYVWHFAMCNKDDKLIYWLFFCTNNLRGLEEMKKAMYRVDRTGSFRFSDKDDPSQLNLFEDYKDDILTKELISRLQGKTLTVFQVKEFVLTKTPVYLYKPALKILEDEGLLKVVNAPAKRRKGTFPDDQMQVKFLSTKY